MACPCRKVLPQGTKNFKPTDHRDKRQNFLHESLEMLVAGTTSASTLWFLTYVSRDLDHIMLIDLGYMLCPGRCYPILTREYS